LPQKFIGLAVAFSGHYGGLIDSKDDYLEKQSKRIDFDNLKIQLKAEGKSYGIIVSSDTDSAEVRYCLGMVNPFNQCQSNLRVLKQKGSKKGRYFFYDEKLTESLQNEDSLILFAYDKDQVLQRKRVVSLKKR